MEKQNGVYTVPCTVNGLKLKFIFDTGAGDVSISLSEAVFMIKNGYMKEEDLIGTEYYRIANGEVAEGTKIIIRKLEIGNKTLFNVEASIVHTLSAPLLLGQSAIQRFGKFSIDYATNTLTLGDEKNPINANQTTNKNIESKENSEVINKQKLEVIEPSTYMPNYPVFETALKAYNSANYRLAYNEAWEAMFNASSKINFEGMFLVAKSAFMLGNKDAITYAREALYLNLENEKCKMACQNLILQIEHSER